MNSTILFTGGLDSTILALQNPDAQLAYVKTGHKYQLEELHSIKRISDRLDRDVKIFCGALIGTLEKPDGHIPHRNLCLLTTVAAFTECDTLILGNVKGESSPDKSRRFIKATQKALSNSEHRRIKISTPLRSRTKIEWINLLLKKGDHRDLLLSTMSCYSPEDGIHCGKCQACFRRWVALSANSVTETYATDPLIYGRHIMRKDNLLTGLSYLTGTPVSEWLGIVKNNLQAKKVLNGWKY